MPTFWTRNNKIIVNELGQPISCDECPCVEDDGLRTGENHLGVHARGCPFLKSDFSITPDNHYSVESLDGKVPDQQVFATIHQVDRWANYENAGNPFVQASGSATPNLIRPTLFYEDSLCRVSLRFNASNNQFIGKSSNAITAATIIIVCKPESYAGPNIRIMWAHNGGADSYFLAQTPTDGTNRWRPTASVSTINGPNVLTGEWQVVSVVFNGANSRVRLNGGTAVTGSLSTPGSSILDERIGNRVNFPWSGLVCEFVSFNSAISAANELSIVGTLMDKWGIT